MPIEHDCYQQQGAHSEDEGKILQQTSGPSAEHICSQGRAGRFYVAKLGGKKYSGKKDWNSKYGLGNSAGKAGEPGI